MSAIASVLAAMGHRVIGSRPEGVGRRSSGSGPRASTVARRPRRRERRRGATSVAVSTAIRRRNPEVAGRARAGHPGAAPGRDPGRHRGDAPHAGGVRHPRQDDDLVDARPGARRGRACARRSSSAARSTRSAPARSGPTATGSWSRPTRATAPSSSSAPKVAVVTNVEADHLDHYGDLAGVEAAFDRFLADAPGPNLVCADDPGAARLGARHGAAHLRHRPRRRLPHRRRRGRPGGQQLVRSGPRRRACSAGSSCRCPGLHNARNATAAIVAGAAGRRVLRARPRPPSAATPAWPAASSSGARPPASPSSTTTPTTRARCGAVLAAARPAGGAGSSRLPAPPLHPHRGPAARLRRPFVDADVVVVTDVYARRRAPRPGVTGQAASSTPCSTRTPGRGSRGSPRREDLVPFLARRAAARRPLPHARRRRHHLAARRAARPASSGRARTVTAPDGARGRPPGCSATGPGPTSPLGPLTTYRVGGPAAAVRPGRGRGRPRRAGRGGARPAGVADAGRRPGLEPAGRRRRLRRRRRSPSGTRSPRSTVERHRWCAPAARRQPAGGGPADASLAG